MKRRPFHQLHPAAYNRQQALNRAARQRYAGAKRKAAR